ncbi:TPA: DNA-binding protein WhiA [Clostridioides difficile]|uniref:DNA-binding protein WhiA n=1 Tax=Clostridioides difficile TaxID=1496 RepID=UPI00038DB0E5|nr:DNA-binding protein WhiA [Clostridioides difficile]AXU29442.1 sporulation regulator WhiA [Clostridioides difficile]AXU33230.1 sporulation regulator WhiA [Clostridioides difficile]AXU37016.1 sporulation regulator WhiA [Clostridioides difficile]EQE83048.1 sporulation Regulator WhiA C terminal domain protein [Clostridioides difficile CD69]KJF63340.1 sporulation regulator WhiA [Clostridioides difficile]
MSFSTETKNELARVVSGNECCNIAELSALVKSGGSIQIVGYKKLNLKITTELNSIARKVFKLLKKNFNINTTISVNKNQMLKRNNSYVLMVTSEMGSEMLLKKLGILENKEGFFTINKISENLIKHEGCKRAFIRGAFLGGGSISDPEKNYHMEFVTNNEEFADSLKELINSLGFNSKIVARKNNHVVYIKESEQISDLLSIIGGHHALLSLQNTKIVKEMRNNVNRIVNCETANLSKTVNAAVRQVENIKLIQETIGISSLPENLQEIAKIRIEYEDMTLKELGEMLETPIGKSGVNHRLRKIEEIATDLKKKSSQ